MNKVNLEAIKHNIVLMQLKDGPVIIELLPHLAPVHVERIKELIHQGFYDNLTFHRVIKDFMAQTGDPTGTGRGGSGFKMKDEIAGAHHVRGMLSMANAGPNTDDSQFFITFVPTPWLDDKHTIFGRILNGMEVVDKINGGGTPSGAPNGLPDRILSMKLAQDLTEGDIDLEVEDTGPSSTEYLGSVESVYSLD